MNFLILLFLLLFTINAYTIEKKNVPALTMEQIANATLFIDFNGDANKQKIKLKKGHYEKRKQGSDTLSIDLTTWMKFTDLDKDGSEDAAVIYVWSKGGEEIFYELAAFVNIKGKAKHLTSIGLGDRVVIKSLEMQGDTVQLDMLTHGEGDANCCPTLPVKLSYLPAEGKLVDQTNYVGIYRGKLTYGGTVYRITSMNVNSDNTVEMIISTIEITIRMTGKWYKKDDGSLLVDFAEGSGWPSGDQLVFRFLNNKLTSMSHKSKTYSEGELEFERVSK